MLKPTQVTGLKRGNGKILVFFEDGSETLFTDTSVHRVDKYLESLQNKSVLCMVLNDSTKIPIDPESINKDKAAELLYSIAQAFNPEYPIINQPIQDRLISAIAGYSTII